MKKFLIISVISFLYSLIYSQSLTKILADDILLKQKINEDPSILDRYIQYEKDFKILVDKSVLNNWLEKTDTLINGKRIIPVVVHVIHKYGNENISDAQIHDAI